MLHFCMIVCYHRYHNLAIVFDAITTTDEGAEAWTVSGHRALTKAKPKHPFKSFAAQA